MNIEALRHVLLLGDLEAHDEFVAPRRAVNRIARRVGPTMLERLQHGGHFLANAAGAIAMDQSGDTAHRDVSFLFSSPQWGEEGARRARVGKVRAARSHPGWRPSPCPLPLREREK